ncbi:MAG: sugar phosphate isomerase/epimerase family protein [Opitutaceae bacterium]|nr:sugar phosphate isomerase/epimerase family protein [Opitutaceae bacterium]
MNNLTRRDFVKLSAAAGLTAAATPAWSIAAGSKATAGGGAFRRSGKPRLLLSLAAYSFRETFPMMRGKPNTKMPAGKRSDLFKFVDFCAANGCDGTELTSYFFDEESDAYLLKLRRHCYLAGMPISGTAIGNNFSHPKGPKRDAEIEYTKKWIDHAALLGAPHIRVFAGTTKELDRKEADKLVITALEECGAYAAKRGIFLGLENHDSIGSADTLLPMVKAVNNPWVGVNLDSGNFKTQDPYKDFAECVPFTLNVQFKSEISDGSGTGRKPADFKRLAKILRDGGYQGWVALEYEGKEDSVVAVPRLLREMKEIFAG